MGILVRIYTYDPSIWRDSHNSFIFPFPLCRAANVMFGVFQSPFYAFSQTIMAELSPPGYDNMFFGLFGLSNVVSSAIGPTVVQAIIGANNNNWLGFTFLFGLCLLAALVIWFFVDVKKGKRDGASSFYFLSQLSNIYRSRS